MADQIVKAHGGRLELDERTRARQPLHHLLPVDRESRMTRILIVEDEPSIALALEDDLRREGYETELATDGDTAERARRCRASST